MSLPLEWFGMIGDGESVALVSREGSIDWLCLPRFDSPACCAALLGTPEHGHWSIAPLEPVQQARQQYEPDTLVLQTELSCASGTIRLTDFMPPREQEPLVVRLVTGMAGRVAVQMNAALRFDYGRMAPWIARCSDDPDVMLLQVGPDEVSLHGVGAAAEITHDDVRERFELSPGERRVFVLRHRFFDRLAGNGRLRAPSQAEQALEATRQYWRGWIGRLDRPTAFPAALRRSLLTLKALVHRPTGGLVAAATTSLPEKPGGKLNWDYRYCWLRDASFAVSALLECGFHDEAQAWRDWMLRAVAAEPEKMNIVYRVDGSRRLDEAELDWLPGYRFAQPVRIGNAAAAQFQLDVYGEVMNTLHLCEQAGLPDSAPLRWLQPQIAEHVRKVWTQPDQGLWESRGAPHHYTYSKVMAWVAIDRFLRSAGSGQIAAAERQAFEALRERIRAVVCKEGFDAGLGTFTSFFGGQEIDASLLLLPKLGFLPADEPRMAATIAAIEEQLMQGGLVYRSRSTDLVPEGAFVACTLWLAECQLLQGRRVQAQATIERVLGLTSDPGLLSEEYDVAGKRLAGNFPQTLSHIALVNALLALERAS